MQVGGEASQRTQARECGPWPGGGPSVRARRSEDAVDQAVLASFRFVRRARPVGSLFSRRIFTRAPSAAAMRIIVFSSRFRALPDSILAMR